MRTTTNGREPASPAVRTRMSALVRLARRAGSTKVGVRLTREAAREGRAEAILVADDLAPNQRERWIERWRGEGVAVYTGWSKDELGEIAGKPAVAALTITDRNIAAGLAELAERSSDRRPESDRGRKEGEEPIRG